MKPNPRDARLEYFAERSLEAHRLLPDQGPLLVAVSGGPDSVALLHFLAALQARTGRPSALVAAHVNHGLRGAESDGDAVFVRDLALAWGLAYLEAGVGPLLRDSSEESARHARYEALRELAQEAGADRVATAHTADDQAETVLLRLLRGAGLRGLGGMPFRGRVRGIRVVRPLLEVTRDQVVEYLGRLKLPHRVDSSNGSRVPARNYLRLEILPRIRERMNPSAREAILRAASAIRESEEYLAAESRRILPTLLKREEGKISLDAALLLAYPKPLRTYLFRDAVQELNGDVRDLAATHLDALLSLVMTPSRRSADLPGGIRARRDGSRVLLELRIHESTARKAPSNGREPRRPCR